MLAESVKYRNTIMLRTFIVLAMVFIAIERASSIHNDVGAGQSKMSTCMLNNGMKSLRLFMMGMSPKCDENGNLLPMQCFDHSEYCVCVRKDGSLLNKPSKGFKGCQCLVTKDEEENSGLIGNYIPQCEADGSYKKMQCHYSTGYCYCADPTTGRNTTVPSRQDANCD